MKIGCLKRKASGSNYCTLHKKNGKLTDKEKAHLNAGSKTNKISSEIDGYDDPSDFADDWEDEFDSWEDAYEYWEDEMN